MRICQRLEANDIINKLWNHKWLGPFIVVGILELSVSYRSHLTNILYSLETVNI